MSTTSTYTEVGQFPTMPIEELIKIMTGGSSLPGPLIANVLTEGEPTLDVSWAEIVAAWNDDREIYIALFGKRVPVVELEPTGDDAGFTASLTSYIGENTGLIFTINYSGADGSLDYTNHSFSVTEVDL